MEKLLAERLLELCHLHAQGRLNDIELACGARDVTFLGEADKILQLLEIHAATLIVAPQPSSLLMMISIKINYLF